MMNDNKFNGGYTKEKSMIDVEDIHSDAKHKSASGIMALMVISARMLYLLHTLLTIWRVTVVLGNQFWYLAAGLITFVLDAVFVLVKRKGKEWTWFQPIVLFYLLIELPSIWLLELHKTSTVQKKYNESVILGDLFENSGTDYLADAIDVNISNETWALMLEQSMLVLIIIARWMMPKGDLTREQLSALLLCYLGVASDVVDFFSVLAESETLLLDIIFVFTILSTWSWSMFQFIFVTSMTQSRDDEEDDIHKLLEKDSISLEDEDLRNDKNESKGCSTKIRVIVESEIWSIFVSILMQDGPYVVVRLVCVIYWNIRTYTNYFFTAKNCLVLILQVYRLVAVYHESHKQIQEKEEKQKKTQNKIKLFLKQKASVKNAVSPDDHSMAVQKRHGDNTSIDKTIDNNVPKNDNTSVFEW